MRPGLIALAGPTASGKSDLALRLAERLGGVVINADSMQLYRDLRILTARPTDADLTRAPHRLYGIVPATPPASVALWLDLAAEAIREATLSGRVPVVVGGTGLYLEALFDGIAELPAVPPAARAEATDLHARLGGEAFRARLAECDPTTAARLPASDRQRLIRAFEVATATGRPLSTWLTAPRRRVALPEPALRLALSPPRDASRDRAAARFDAMLAAGALDEVGRLASLGLDPDLQLMKALGVPELLAHLRGELALDEARARAITATRRYAKRQRTWLRHRLPGFRVVEAFGEAAAVDALLG